ncbi:MAG: N-acetyltransferase family protein [Acidobacteriota bacterium]
MHIVACTYDGHARAILDILNDAILNSTALYDYRPRTLDMMIPWFEAKTKGGFPVIGAEDEHGSLMGFGSYGVFRERPAYKYTVEHSVYVSARFRRQGVGRRLLEEVIQAATDQDLHVLVGGIDASNTASIALHEQCGFTRCGIVRHAGFKFGRWLDLAFYQRILDTPLEPIDG